MNKKILFVDDEENVLAGLRRLLHKSFDIYTAQGPEAGLEMLHSSLEFSVIVADMKMPGMNGIEFLLQAQQLSPDSVRIMLTGNEGQQTAVQAVNTGEVFRFLNKPCERDLLVNTLNLAVRQYQLIRAEKDLLNRTLKGSINALCDVLSIAKPIAFGRVKRLRDKCNQVAKQLSRTPSWEFDTAVLLSQLGCINIPQEILEKVSRGESLGREENKEYLRHPEKGAQLIQKIPRLKKVAKIVAYQHKSFDGSGFPYDECKGDNIPIEARILNAVLAFDGKKNAGWSDTAALEALHKQAAKFDPNVLKGLANCASKSKQITVRVNINELCNGMVIEEDVLSESNALLLCRGSTVNTIIREHLIEFKKNGVLDKQILVTHPES